MTNPEHFIQKINKTREKLGHRKGPNILWLKEKEDDSKLAFPDAKFRNGIPTMARTLNDLEEGIAVFAGKPNSGKSTLLVNMMLQALELNEDVMVLDFSFDDPINKRYQQYIAALTRLKYQQITTASDLRPHEIKAKAEAHELIVRYYSEDRLRTYEAIETFKASSGELITTPVRKFENIIRILEQARREYPEKKIVCFVDALNNIDPTGATMKSENEISVMNQRLAELQNKCNYNKIICIVSAHLRKSSDKRIGADDIKGTSDLNYNAVWLGIVRNEYRENALTNPLEYEDPNDHVIYPIITVEVHKTKVSSWDYNLYYALDSGACTIMPLTKEEYQTIAVLANGKRK